MALKVVADPDTRIITVIDVPVDGRTELHVVTDIYSPLKDDWLITPALQKLKFPLREQVGQETGQGQIGPYVFIYNQDGWRILPYDSDHELTIIGGNLRPQSAVEGLIGVPIWLPRPGRTIIIPLELSAQAISVAGGGGTGGLTASQDAKLTAIDTRTIAINSRTITIEAIAVSTEGKVDTVDLVVDGISTQLIATDLVVDGIDTQLTATDLKVDTINNTTAATGVKATTTINNLAIVDGVVDSILTVVNGIDTALTSIGGIEDKIDTIDTVVDATKLVVDSNATAIGVVEGKVDTVDTVVDGIDISLTGVGRIEDKIDVIDGVVDANGAAIAVVGGKVDTVDTVVDVTKIVLDSLDTAITGIGGVEDKIDVIDGVVDDTKLVVDTIDTTTVATGMTATSIEGKVDVMDLVVDAIKLVVDSIDVALTGIGGIEDKIDTIDSVVDATKIVVDTVNVKADAIDNKVNSIDTTVSTIDTTTSATGSKVDIIDGVVDATKLVVDAMDPKLDIIDANVDTIVVTTAATGVLATGIDGKVDVIDAIVDIINTETASTGVIVASTATDVTSIGITTTATGITVTDTNNRIGTIETSTTASEAGIETAAFNGGVTIDADNGVFGTAYPLGTPGHPINNMNDAMAIATARSLKKLYIRGELSITAGWDLVGFEFEGASISTASVSIGPAALIFGCNINNCQISGILDGDTSIERCLIKELTYIDGNVFQCGLEGPMTLGGSTQANFFDCWSNIAGTNKPIIDFGGSGRNLGIRNYSGGLELRNKTGVSDRVSIDMNSGHIVLSDTVTAGEIVVRGVGTLDDFSAGANVVQDNFIAVGGLSEMQNRMLSEHWQIKGMDMNNVTKIFQTGNKPTGIEVGGVKLAFSQPVPGGDITITRVP